MSSSHREEVNPEPEEREETRQGYFESYIDKLPTHWNNTSVKVSLWFLLSGLAIWLLLSSFIYFTDESTEKDGLVGIQLVKLFGGVILAFALYIAMLQAFSPKREEAVNEFSATESDVSPYQRQQERHADVFEYRTGMNANTHDPLTTHDNDIHVFPDGHDPDDSVSYGRPITQPAKQRIDLVQDRVYATPMVRGIRASLRFQERLNDPRRQGSLYQLRRDAAIERIARERRNFVGRISKRAQHMGVYMPKLTNITNSHMGVQSTNNINT